MKRELFLSDRQFRKIARMYFSIAGNAKYNANPFKDITEFLQARVGDLKWGTDESTKNSSKSGFVESFSRMLEAYNFHVPVQEILKDLSDDKLSNEEVVEKLIVAGHFGNK